MTHDATTDRYRGFLHSVPHALAVSDGSRVDDANPAFVRLLGAQFLATLVGRALTDLVVADDRARLASAIDRSAAGDAVEPIDVRLARTDGTTLCAELTLVRFDVQARQSSRLLLAARDTSREKNLEARLAQTERAATLGMLVAGVAHEINNPLAYALGSLDIAVRRLESVDADAASEDPRSAAIRQCLNNARDGVERVRLIVRDLSNLSRPITSGAVGVDVESVLDSAVNLAWNELRHRARVVKRYAAVPAAVGDSVRLGQVFLNLLVNAAQAIPDGRAFDAEIRLVTYVDADLVVVEVHDTGLGMTPDVAARIFDPFFTTKTAEAGTGLGLSICREIVTSIGGGLEFSTEPGKGSCFRVKLPFARATEVAEPAAVSEDEPPRSAAVRVLVIDDEPLLGHTLRLALQGYHEVVVVSSGREALSSLDKDDRYDAILCDLMMPDVNGIVVYRTVCERHPALANRFAFMTGGAFTAEAREFFRDFDGPRLEKPFDVRQVDALLAAMTRAR